MTETQTMIEEFRAEGWSDEDLAAVPGFIADARAEWQDPRVRDGFKREVAREFDGKHVARLGKSDQRCASELVQDGYLTHRGDGVLRAV